LVGPGPPTSNSWPYGRLRRAGRVDHVAHRTMAAPPRFSIRTAVDYAALSLRISMYPEAFVSRTATARLAAPLAPDATSAVAEMQARVEELLAGRGPLRVLEAGCGPRMHLTFPSDAYVVGVDEDDVALARNEVISEAIVADLGTYKPEPASFDAIV